ncbi:hypothetical protein WEH80_13920 [Actinomycetes bacterium KLBMP 9759]
MGKSRSLFEALRHQGIGGDVRLVAPTDADALKALLLPGQSPVLRSERAVLWLDNLEPFLNQGLTWQTLHEWHSSGRPGHSGTRIVVATNGGKGSDRVSGAATSGLSTAEGELLQHAREIPMAATTAEEEAELPAIAATGVDAKPEDREAIRLSGLAAFLVAGPKLERKLNTGRHGPGQKPCPDGLVVVEVVADWARCGRTDSIIDSLLRQRWPAYLAAGARTTNEAYKAALEWALEPVVPHIALISGTDSYTAYDYVVRLRCQDPAAAPLDQVWDAAITTASPAQANGVAYSAYQAGRIADTATAYERAEASTDAYTAAKAGNNRALILSELERPTEAIALLDQLVRKYVDDSSPAVRTHLVRALTNQAAELGRLERHEEALTVLSQVVTAYHGATAPDLRTRVAMAMANQALVLIHLRRADEALDVLARVDADYSADTDTNVQAVVAITLFNRGLALDGLGHHTEALAAFSRVDADYSDHTDPAVRILVAQALANRGIELVKLGRPDEAATCYGRVVVENCGDPAPEVQAAVERARRLQGT